MKKLLTNLTWKKSKNLSKSIFLRKFISIIYGTPRNSVEITFKQNFKHQLQNFQKFYFRNARLLQKYFQKLISSKNMVLTKSLRFLSFFFLNKLLGFLNTLFSGTTFWGHIPMEQDQNRPGYNAVIYAQRA